MSSQTLNYVPENLPPRAVTSESVAWPPSDSSTAPWESAHITISGGEVMFADQSLNEIPYTEMVPQRSLEWYEIDAIVDTHFENGWRCVVFLGIDGDTVRSVLVPWAHFLPQDTQNSDNPENPTVDPFLVALAREVQEVATDEDVTTFPGNLDYLVSFAGPGNLETIEL